MNPLLTPGQVFDLGLMNPNPSSSKTKDGPVYRVSFEVDRETWDLFMEADCKGLVIGAKACVADDGAAPEGVDDQGQAVRTQPTGSGPYADHSRALIASGFYTIKQVWPHLGKDEDYLRWLRGRRCRAAGLHADLVCSGEVVAAHIREVAHGAGTAIKPPYRAISLCDNHHRAQHQQGMAHIGTEAWWARQWCQQFTDWGRERLAAHFGEEAVSFVRPLRIVGWAKACGIADHLPAIFRQLEREAG